MKPPSASPAGNPPPRPATGSVVPDGNTLRRVEPAPEPGERRRSQRCPESASAWLSASGDVTSFHAGTTVAINDLSLHGVGFNSQRPLEPGARHWIVIARGPMRLSTRLRVASCRPSTDGSGYQIGGEFY